MTNHSWSVAGFSIVRSVLTDAEIEQLKKEIDLLPERQGKNCFRDICSLSPRCLSLAAKLGRRFAEGMICVRSILFDKTPDRNWPVAWHQDMTISVGRKVEVPGYSCWTVKGGVDSVQPPLDVLESMVTVRLHLDDTPGENGALSVVPGSHLLGKIDTDEIRKYIYDNVVCECKAGDVMLMSPLILHSSRRSTQPGHRRVLHLEYAEESSLAAELEWAVKIENDEL
ncbi:MAG: phytanoyl-CoA dioxygenase family protein [Verrucomicrobiales bacterium]|nr:phytanoyl-CoA dioxygenase family protein [Verrucomicrobiales bacterium]